jgi:hypothetical protein
MRALRVTAESSVILMIMAKLTAGKHLLNLEVENPALILSKTQ